LWSLNKFGKWVFLLKRVQISINNMDKLLSSNQNLGAKTHKKCYHIGIWEGVILWSLTFNVNVHRINFPSQPIKLLESFVLQLTVVAWRPLKVCKPMSATFPLPTSTIWTHHHQLFLDCRLWPLLKSTLWTNFVVVMAPT
jgi:hypothetical protein